MTAKHTKEGFCEPPVQEWELQNHEGVLRSL